MALDAANFIAELSITDPPGSDPLSQGDDQIRTIKRATFQSFPNIDAAVNLSTAQLNLAAIKNEANVFTVTKNQFTNQVDIKKSGPTQLAGHFYLDDGGFARWGFFMSTAANGEPMTLQRRDALGVLIDLPFQVRLTDGVVEFTVPPEIAGAPIWIAGEVRQFVATAAPGGNWFKADGTNGTVNLLGRHLMTESAFDTVGTAHNASLTSVTAVAGNTGATAITAAQMPVHAHDPWVSNDQGGGITDIGLNAATVWGFGGRRNDNSRHFSNLRSGGLLINNAGSGATHLHTSPAKALAIGEPTFTDSVRPLGFVVQSFQYVP